MPPTHTHTHLTCVSTACANVCVQLYSKVALLGSFEALRMSSIL